MKKEEGDIILKIHPTFEKRIKTASNLFYNWFKEIKSVNVSKKIEYESIVKKQLKLLKKYKMNKTLQLLYNLYEMVFYKYSLNGKRYLLHGDINMKNILCNKNNIILIDPSPIYGIKKLELVKYI